LFLSGNIIKVASLVPEIQVYLVLVKTFLNYILGLWQFVRSWCLLDALVDWGQ